MANEQTYTGKSDLFVATLLNRALRMNLADMSDLRQLCENRGNLAGGSLAEEQVGITPDDAMAAANSDELTAPTPTDMGTSTATITVARQVLVRNVTDPYVIAGGPRPGLELFAEDMGGAARNRFADILCGLFTSVSTSVGDSSDLTVDTLMSALYAFTLARNGGKADFVGAPICVNHLLASMEGLGGSGQWNPATEAIQALSDSWPGYGLRGEWRGIRVWDVDSVVTNGAYKENCLLSRSCFGFKEGIPSELARYAGPGSFVKAAPNGAPIFVEFQRIARAGGTDVVGNYYVGISELEDARAVLVKGSAT